MKNINVGNLRDSLFLEIRNYAVVEDNSFGIFDIESKFYSSLEAAIRRNKDKEDFKERMFKFINKRVLLPEDSLEVLSVIFDEHIRSHSKHSGLRIVKKIC